MHEQFAKGDGAVAALFGQRVVQLARGDVPQADQGLAHAHHGHARLGLQRLRHLLGGDHLVVEQLVADALLAQLRLLGQGGVDLRRRRRIVGQQLLADLGTEIELLVGAARAEHAQHGALVAHRREQEHALRHLDVTDGLALDEFAADEVEHVVGAGMEVEQLPRRAGDGADGRTQRRGQREAAELRKPQRHRRARRGQLDLGQALLEIELRQARGHRMAVHAQDLAGLEVDEGQGIRVDRVRRRRPAERGGARRPRAAWRERVQLVGNQGQLRGKVGHAGCSFGRGTARHRC